MASYSLILIDQHYIFQYLEYNFYHECNWLGKGLTHLMRNQNSTYLDKYKKWLVRKAKDERNSKRLHTLVAKFVLNADAKGKLVTWKILPPPPLPPFLERGPKVVIVRMSTLHSHELLSGATNSYINK